MQDIITATQFADFALQLLQTLAFSGAQSAITAIGIPFMLAKARYEESPACSLSWGRWS